MKSLRLLTVLLTLVSPVVAQLCRDRINPPGAPFTPYTFGEAVALGEQFAAIGSSMSYSGTALGAAALYARNPVTGRLDFMQAVTASDGLPGDRFGASIAIDDDRVVVGAPYQDRMGVVRAGAAYVYRLVSGAWIEEAKLLPSSFGSDLRFGRAVSISGSRIVVGQWEGAHLFEFNGAMWVERGLFGTSGRAVSIDGDILASGSGAYRFHHALGIWINELPYPESDHVAISGNVVVYQPSFAPQDIQFMRRNAASGTWNNIGSYPNSGNVSAIALEGSQFAALVWGVIAVHAVPPGPSPLVTVPLDPYTATTVSISLLANSLLSGVVGTTLYDWVYLHDLLCLSSVISTPVCPQMATNSTGVPGRIDVIGSRIIAQQNAALVASQLPLNSFGFFLSSRTPGLTVAPGSAQGNLCLAGNIGRYVASGQIKNTGNIGRFELGIDLLAMPTPTGSVAALPGETWYFQAWHRDLNPFLVSNFTDSARVQWQ